MDKDFIGKTVIVTGAGGGIGRAIADAFYKLQATVCITDLSLKAAKETQEIIGSERSQVYELDVTDKKNVESVFKKIEETNIAYDVLASNAGVSTMNYVDNLSEEEWDFNMNVNAKGIFLTNQAAIKFFKKSKIKGKIVNTASLAAKVGAPLLAHYSASKFAVVGFTQALAREVAKDGISQTYKKLEHSSDTLENKLDAIIDALRYSNNQEKKLADERETSAKKTEQKMATDMSSANQILMQDMDNEEIRQMRADDMAEDDRGPIVNTPPQNPDQLDIPFAGEFSEGGIASGPDSGYLAVLHGDEAVIPLDNNYTQGQPSAIGQKPIATMPMMAERGTDNSNSMTPTFRPNISMASPPSISLGSRSTGGSGAGDMLAKAIQLPSKAAGLVTMGLMNKVLRTENIDGYKYFFENDAWLLIRPSGTEPVLRTYAESSSSEKAFDILNAVKSVIES